MPYTPQTWVNGDATTPISAARLGVIETGIQGARALAESADQGLAGKAADTAVVHLTGAETVAGVKTFSASPVVPTPTTALQAATKGYADGLMTALDAVPIHYPAIMLNFITGTWTTGSAGGTLTTKTIVDGVGGKVGCSEELPASWTSVNIKVWWCPSDATTGNVMFAGHTAEYNAGDVLGFGTAGSYVSSAAPAVTNKLVLVDLGNFAVTGKELFQFHIEAARAHASDTYTGSVHIIKARVTKVA